MNATTDTKTRAPKGGTVIENVKYEGGQFLPSDNTPKRGMFNSNKGKATSHITRARHYIRIAFKTYFDGDTGACNNNHTMAMASIRKANYWKNKI